MLFSCIHQWNTAVENLPWGERRPAETSIRGRRWRERRDLAPSSTSNVGRAAAKSHRLARRKRPKLQSKCLLRSRCFKESQSEPAMDHGGFGSLKWPAVALKWSNRRSEGGVGKSRARCFQRRSGGRPIIVQRAGTGGEGYQVISGLGRGAWACQMVGRDLEKAIKYTYILYFIAPRPAPAPFLSSGQPSL